MDRYTTLRRLRRPLTAWRRHRAGRLGPINHAVWSAMDYRPAMRSFFHAARANPDLLVDVDLPPGAVVLDVGAFEGEWSARLLARAAAHGAEDLHIHAFEPEPAAVERARAAVGTDPRVDVHAFGVSGRDRTEVLSVSGPGSSVFATPAEAAAFGSTRVELRDIDAVLRELEVERIAFAKINIEGGEFELLDRLYECGWLPRTGPLIIQFHEFGPDAYRARRRNRRQLGETHRCTWDHPWVYERWDPR
jgi:FkbM family methyltransferase